MDSLPRGAISIGRNEALRNLRYVAETYVSLITYVLPATIRDELWVTGPEQASGDPGLPTPAESSTPLQVSAQLGMAALQCLLGRSLFIDVFG